MPISLGHSVEHYNVSTLDFREKLIDKMYKKLFLIK